MDTYPHSAESSPKKDETKKVQPNASITKDSQIPLSTQVHLKMKSRNTPAHNKTENDVVQEKMDEILIRINKSSSKQQAQLQKITKELQNKGIKRESQRSL